MITEDKIINKFLKNLTFNNSKSLKLEDDVYYDPSKKLVFSTDSYEEGIHFFYDDKPKKFIKKIFRSAISDIICKGSKPLTYFLSLQINKINNLWLNDFKNELKKESKKYNVFLGGGDTIKSKKLSITIAVMGDAIKKPILRSGSQINDDIYVTGNLGDSYLGFLLKSKNKNYGKLNRYFTESFYKPNLPVKFSNFLYKFANSSMDISDGIIKDLKNLCNASKCGAVFDFNSLPFSKKAIKICKLNKISLLDIFSRGDDYQILFTSSSKNRKLIQNISIKTFTKVSRVGKITANKNVKMIKDNNFFNLKAVNTSYIHKYL